MQKFIYVFIFTVCCLGLNAQTINGLKHQEQYQLALTRASDAITVDGIMSENTWKNAQMVADFWEKWPHDNKKAKRSTEVRMAYNDQYLYVLAICHDTSTYVIQTLKRDSRFFDGDGFSIVLDPINKRTNGFLFCVSPYNVQSEDLISQNNFGDLNFSWDNKWFSATKRYTDKWIVEIAIPFKTLRFEEANKRWGVNFIRNDLKNNQYSTWTQVPIQFNGTDMGFTGALNWDKPPKKSGGNVSISPYTTGGISQDNLDNEASKTTKDAGFDAKIALNSALNLDLTLNPDFSQIEVDRQVTNLTRFNVFFPERRTFFLENNDLFSEYGAPPFRPFFSRTIGLDSDGNAIPILAGGRISGNVNNSLRLGVFTMQTKAKGDFAQQNYSAFSFGQRVLKRSMIKGYLLNREANLADATADPLKKYGRNGGLEFSYVSANGEWNAWAGVHTSRKEGITTDNNFHQFGGGYFGRKFSFFGDYAQFGTNYYADMGFVQRIENYDAEQDKIIRLGFRQLYNEVEYVIRPEKSKNINSHRWGIENFDVWNPDGTLNERFNRLRYFVSYKNSAQLRFRLDNQDVCLLFPFSFTDATPFSKGSYSFTQGNIDFSSDSRKKMVYVLSVKMGGFYNGTLQQLSGGITYRIQPRANLTMNIEYNKLEFPEPYGKAELLLLNPRIEINFSNSLFWTTFLQYNTQRNNFNINSRLQWRFRPMSDFYLVYTDNYFTDPLFKNKNRALVFKINYWITV